MSYFEQAIAHIPEGTKKKVAGVLNLLAKRHTPDVALLFKEYDIEKPVTPENIIKGVNQYGISFKEALWRIFQKTATPTFEQKVTANIFKSSFSGFNGDASAPETVTKKTFWDYLDMGVKLLNAGSITYLAIKDPKKEPEPPAPQPKPTEEKKIFGMPVWAAISGAIVIVLIGVFVYLKMKKA